MPEPKSAHRKKPAVLLFSLFFLDKIRSLSARTKLLSLAIIIVAALVFGIFRGVFLYRSPLLVVTDASFKALYGPDRLKKIESALSNKLFRRVIPVYVDENAWSDQVSLAAEDAFKTPLAVLFPYRYIGGGDYYKENHPDIPVYITSGRNRSSRAKQAVTFIRTDIKTDLYRAGLCAALFAGEGNVLFITDETLPSEYRNVFIEGLRAQDYEKDPTWGRYNSDFLSVSDLSCAVIAGPVGDFFEKMPDIPVILFSWADPDFTPRSVKVIFDDSPYTLALKEYRLFFSFSIEGEGRVEGESRVESEGEDEGVAEVLISSVPTVLRDRIEEKADYKKLESLVKKEYQNN
jgi:hypothetical protein